MKKTFFLALSIGLILFSIGCKRDEIDKPVVNTPVDTTTNPIPAFVMPTGTNYTCNIFGEVVDEAGAPVVGASVYYGNNTVQTDEFGIYQFKEVGVNSEQSNISVLKSGYLMHQKAIFVRKSTNLRLKQVLIKIDNDLNFDAQSGGSLQKEGVKLNFPAAAVVIKASNVPYSGPVNVDLHYLDPNKPDTYLEMPGNLTGVSEEQKLVVLQSFGMVHVEMTAPNGEPLQIKEGAEVEITMPLGDLASAAPSSIPLWFFDNSTYRWIEEGSATLVGSEYKGKVKHFSWWNFDVPSESIIYSSKLISENGVNVGNKTVSFSAGNIMISNVIVNSDGTFSVRLPKNVAVDMTVELATLCPNNNAQFDILAQSQDIVEADKVIPNSTLPSYDYTVQFTSCANEMLVDGYVQIRNLSTAKSIFFPLYQGIGAFSVFACNASDALEIKGYNLSSGWQSEFMPLPTNEGINNLGAIALCTNLDYLEITDLSGASQLFSNVGNGYYYAANSNDTTFIYNYGDGKRLSGYGNSGSLGITSLAFTYNDNADSLVYVSGTYPINGGLVMRGALHTVQGGTVTINQGGTNPGDAITGSYELYTHFYQQWIVMQDTLSGTFKITIE